MLISGVASLVVSFVFVVVFLNVGIRKNIHFGLIAPPNDEVSTHNKPIPILGGIGIFCYGFAALYFVYLLHEFPLIPFLLGFIPIGVLGCYKDSVQKAISPFIQLAVQVLSSLCLYEYWISVNTIVPGFWSAVVFVFFCCIIINSFNFLDVMDGLAGSYALILLMIHGVVSLYISDLLYILITFSFAGGLIAFLVFNWHPAKLFLGDFGSFGLIYTLLFIVIAIYPVNQVNSYSGFFFIFLVPLSEFFYTVFKRLMQKKRPYIGDANHGSLYLLNIRRWSSGKIVMSAMGITFFTNVVALYLFFR